MSEAVLAAQRAEVAALNARCATSPREAAKYAARLRRAPHAEKVKRLFNESMHNHTALVRLLLADGVSLNTGNAAGRTPLHAAAATGAINVLHVLLEAGADANSCDNYGLTPLARAVSCSKILCAQELVPHTDLRNFNASGNNVLHGSIIANQPEIFNLLLPHVLDDIDVRTIKKRPPGNPDDLYNNTPLLLASVYGHLACVTLLIGRPDNWKMSAAELDARDAKGRTPLYFAARNGHRYCCAALLAAGADPGAASHAGRTALDAAKLRHPGNQELIELLECRGGGPAPLLCAGCGASDKRLHACSVCQSAAFCSQSCFSQAYLAHRPECERIKAVNEELFRIRFRSKAITPAPP